MANIIIGVTGKKRHGKDTFAARLIDQHGFTRIAFADPLKRTMEDLDPIVRVEVDERGLVHEYETWSYGPAHVRLAWLIEQIGWEQAKEIREVRRLLQAHGVAIREHLDEDAWVDAAMATADLVDGPVVITDVRFPNEADSVTYSGRGFLVRVTRPGVESTDAHVSETAMDDVPAYFEVVNSGTVADLHAEADDVVRQLQADYWYLFDN